MKECKDCDFFKSMYHHMTKKGNMWGYCKIHKCQVLAFHTYEYCEQNQKIKEAY